MDTASTIAAYVGLASTPAPIAFLWWMLTRPATTNDPEVTS